MGQGDLSLQGVSLCGAVAIILNLILPQSKQVDDDLHEEQEVVEDMVHHARD